MVIDTLHNATNEIRKIFENKVDLFIRQMVGIVSAGGRGVRLTPRTLAQPKPLIEVGSPKRPLLYWSMLPMILGGVSHFIIGVRYRAEKIIKNIGKGKKLSNLFGRKITITFIEEYEPLGRAGFIENGLIKGVIEPDKPAIIFNASDILRLNLRDLVRRYLYFKAYHGFEIIQVYTSGFRMRYGIGNVDLSTYHVTDFEEKPLRKDLVNTACYLIHERLNDFKNIGEKPSNPEDRLVHQWIRERILGAYIIPYENLISIKFEKDLYRVRDMDIEKYIKSVYE